MNKNFYVAIAILGLILSGCAANTGNQFLTDISPQKIRESLKKGITTKEEVRTMFGDPADVAIDLEGKETWTYAYKRSEAKGINYVPIANLVYKGTNDTIKQLKIQFNKTDTVEVSSLSNSNCETKLGLFQ